MRLFQRCLAAHILSGVADVAPRGVLDNTQGKRVVSYAFHFVFAYADASDPILVFLHVQNMNRIDIALSRLPWFWGRILSDF